MEPCPATARQTVVCGVPDQGVGEPQAPDRAGNLRHDPRLDRLVEQLEHCITIESDDCGHRIDVELATHDRCHREQPFAVSGEVAQAAADDLSHALRNRERSCTRLAQALLRGEQPHDLAHEQRVALRLGVQRRTELGCRSLGRGHLDEAHDVARGEPGKRKPAGDRLARKLGDGAFERVRERWIDVAIGADDQQPAVAELASDESQQEQRRLVRGVEIVQHHYERPRRQPCA